MLYARVQTHYARAGADVDDHSVGNSKEEAMKWMIVALLVFGSSAQAAALCHLIKDRDSRLMCKAVQAGKPSLCSLISDMSKRQECRAISQKK